MAEPGYPHGDALIPERRDEHTIVFLVRPPDAPDFSEEELDRLQVEHLTHLRDLARRGLLIADGPLVDQTNAAFRGISIYRVPLGEALAVEGARWWTAAGDASFGRPSQPG